MFNLRTIFYKLFFFIPLIPVIICLYLVNEFGVNVIYCDDYDVFNWIKFFSSDLSIFLEFFDLHNEHRIFFPRIFYYLLAKISNVDIRCNLIFIYSCFVVISLIFWNYIKKFNNSKFVNVLILFLINCLLFSLVQYENFLWGFQVSFACVFCFSIISLYFFHLYLNNKESNRFYFLIFIIFYIISAFSSAQGLFVGLCTQILLLLIYNYNFYKKKLFWLLLAINILVWYVYFINYHSNPGHGNIKDVFNNPLLAIEYIFCWISSPFLHTVKLPSIILGGGILLLSVFVFCRFFIKKNFNEIFPISLMLFSLIVCSSIVSGRLIFGLEQSLASRYTTFSLLLYESLILIFFINKVKFLSSILGVCFFLLFIFSCSFGYNSLIRFHNVLAENQKIFFNYKNESEGELKKLILPSSITKNIASVFEKNNAGPFYIDFDRFGYKLDDSSNYLWSIDHKVLKKSKDIYIDGWFYKKGISNTGISTVSIVLMDLSNVNFVKLPTELVKRKDVTKFFNDGNDYDYSGFKVELNSSSLENLNNNGYQLYVLYIDNSGEKLVNLNTFLFLEM